jgi:glutaredoxin
MAEGDVVIYTQPGCSACQPQKKFLSQKKGVEFAEKSSQEDEQALLKQLLELGAQRTPITVIGGELL